MAPGDGATTLGDSKRAQDSVKWIQRAFSLVEKMEGTELPGMAELKVRFHINSRKHDFEANMLYNLRGESYAV